MAVAAGAALLPALPPSSLPSVASSAAAAAVGTGVAQIAAREMLSMVSISRTRINHDLYRKNDDFLSINVDFM